MGTTNVNNLTTSSEIINVNNIYKVRIQNGIFDSLHISTDPLFLSLLPMRE